MGIVFTKKQSFTLWRDNREISQHTSIQEAGESASSDAAVNGSGIYQVKVGTEIYYEIVISDVVCDPVPEPPPPEPPPIDPGNAHYPGISVTPDAVALDFAKAAPNGSVMLVIGMSNTKQFTDKLLPLSTLYNVKIVNAAQGGKVAGNWAKPNDDAWTKANSELSRVGKSASDVSVVWVVAVNRAKPSVQTLTEYLTRLKSDYDALVVTLKTKFPGVLILMSGLHHENFAPSNSKQPGPHARESSTLVNDMVAENINVAWGPYLWNDEPTPRPDGFSIPLSMFNQDKVHLTSEGSQYVADRIDEWFSINPIGIALSGSEPVPVPEPKPNPTPGTLKYNPGNYIRVAGNPMKPDYMDKAIASIKSDLLNNSLFDGALMAFAWGILNPTGGDMDLSPIRQIMDILRPAGKRLALMVMSKSFTSSSASFEAPADLKQSIIPTNSGWWGGTHNPIIMERLANCFEAIADEFDDDPLFEMVMPVESAPSFGGGFKPEDYDIGIYAQAIKDLATRMNTDFPTTQVCMNLNSLGSELIGLFEHGFNEGVCIAGPDARPVPAWDIFAGRGGAPRDYRGELPRALTVSKSTLDIDTPEQIILNLQNDQSASYVFWITYQNFGDVQAAISANPFVFTDIPKQQQ